MAARQSGSYEIGWWASECVVLIAAVYVLFAAGQRPPSIVGAAAAALLLLGCWSVASIAWGGNREDAWRFAGRSVLAAAALVLGGQLRRGVRRAAVAGVALGFVALAVELVARVGAGRAPADWFYGRTLDGPVGYHNAQGAVFAAGSALLAPGLASIAPARRAASAAGIAVLLAALLLTQSRGALAAAALGALIVGALMRDARLSVRLFLFVPVTAALLAQLRSVDLALAGRPGAAEPQLTTYAAAAAAASVVCAAAAALPVRVTWARRGLAVAAVAVVVVAAGWLHRPLGAAAHAARLQLATDVRLQAAPGSTRFASLSPNGRRDAWRVGFDVWRARPVVGVGQGMFAREWTISRRTTLYILQPHSIEVELAAELGAIGLGLFAGFVLLGFRCLGRLQRPAAAAAAGMLAVVLLQASVDWTWSFPGLVVPVLGVVGACAVRRPRRRVPSAAIAAVAAIAVAAIAVAVAVPALADGAVSRAGRQAARQPSVAWATLVDAHRLDPWNDEVVMLQGDLASASGNMPLAADRYALAARLSRRPWVALYAEARASSAAGADRVASALCRQASSENPLEPLLTTGPCAGVGPDRREGRRRAKALEAAAVGRPGLRVR